MFRGIQASLTSLRAVRIACNSSDAVSALFRAARNTLLTHAGSSSDSCYSAVERFSVPLAFFGTTPYFLPAQQSLLPVSTERSSLGNNGKKDMKAHLVFRSQSTLQQPFGGRFTQDRIQTRLAHSVQVNSQSSAPQPFATAGEPSQEKVHAKAQLIFDTCWRRLETKLQGKLQLPKEIVWLNGAPGSGKGVNTPFILESRGLSRAVTMSSLFQESEEIRQVMDRGELVPDTMVGDALLDTIFEPDADAAGLVIDGFPRTALQVELLKLLYDKMMALHVQHADTPDEFRFPRPSFKIVVLYVEADESIKRQLLRARQASLHNRRVLDAGAGNLQDIRTTDEDIVKCRRRYEVFKAHYGTLLRLKQYFPFSLIDAMGSVEECRQQISREMRYQSSMDLAEATYSAIRHLPLARELVRTSRQHLVSHLDMYCKKHNHIFMQVIKVIDDEAIPVLKRCSLAGHAELKTHNPLFSEAPIAADMLMDILTDRGFATAYFVDEQVVPYKVNLDTGHIVNRYEHLHHFRITFESAKVRSGSVGPIPPPAFAAEAQPADPTKPRGGTGCSPSKEDEHSQQEELRVQETLNQLDKGAMAASKAGR